jgi:Tol biopolymer transport system component
VMDADGSHPRNLSNNPVSLDGSPLWSPDGARIIFDSRRDGNREIYVMSADGSNVTRLTDNPADDYGPVWEP